VWRARGVAPRSELPSTPTTKRSTARLGIDTLESFEADGDAQWIHIRGVDTSNPVLLLIQQGPGLPMLNEVRRFERLLGLESDFTVVYWDQRGCGRSLRGNHELADLSVQRMTDDTITLLELLRSRFGTSALVAGFSFGATVGAIAAQRRPDLVSTLVAVGMDVDGKAAAANAYEFAARTANERHNRRASRQLKAIGPPPHLTAKQFSTRARWAMNFGGVSTKETYGVLVWNLISSLLRSSDYSLADVPRTLRGITATQAALLSDLATLDLVVALPRLGVPIVMAQGRHDQVAPAAAAERYFGSLDAPSKRLVWFEDSAHTPQLEEPGLFRELLIRIREGELAPT